MDKNKILTYSLISLAGIATIVGAIFGIRYLINMKPKDKKDDTTTPNTTTPTTTTSDEYYDGEAGKPTNNEIILMGDNQLSWDRLYTLGTNLGLSKNQVNTIVNAGRPTFATVIAKYPDWRTYLTDICTDMGITLKSTPGFTGFAN